MKYAAYEEFSESSLDWTGPIPSHWKIKKIGHLALLKSGENIVSEEIAEGGEYPVFGGNGFRGYFHQYTHEGSFVLIGRQGALCGNINYASGKFWASEHALVAHSLTDFDVRWFGETLRAMNLNQYSVSAAQPGLAASAISALRMPCPPIDEQQTIARFLDAKTSQIDELINKKRQLIDKLKEKRQALIARTVTRGLPPEAAKVVGLEPKPEMENAEEAWIGEMPVHWKVKKGSHLGRLIGSVAPAEDDITEDDDGVPYAKVDDLNFLDSSLRLTSTKVRLQCAPPRWNTIILFPKRGAAIFTNKVALAQRVTFDSNLMGWEIYKDSDPKFVAYCLISRRLDDLADVSTVPQINNKHINPAKFPHPPRYEQEAIVAFLDSETARIDQFVDNVERAIARLTEYRQALITSAVTGKIDVRGLA